MRRSRIAVYLCLLVLFNELGPANLHRIQSHKLQHRQSKRVHKNDVDADKRGIGSLFGKVGKYILKGLTFSSKFLEVASSITTVIVTFYNLVTQCCSGAYSEACTWTNEAKEIAAQLDRNSTTINDMGLEIKNLEAAVMLASEEFNFTVNEMYKIGDASSRLLKSLDPNVTVALQLTTNKLEKLIQAKNATGERVKYITLETTYFNVLDGILGTAVPIFTSIIPAVPKVRLWIKARMGRYKSFELDHSVDAKVIEPPKRSSDRYQASKSWFGKQTSKIAFKVDTLKFNLNAKYEKALKVVKGIKQGFDLALSFVKTGYSIYLLYTQFTKCKDAKDKAKEGLDKMKRARDQMNEVYTGVVEARATMRKARDQLYEDLKSEVFINDLRELKGTLEKLSEDGTDQEFRAMLDEIDSYINNIQNKDPGFVEVYHMIANLYQALGTVSYYINCYTAKTSVVRTVLDECREGQGSIQQLNEQARIYYESNADTCRGKIGMAPFSDETLQQMIDQQSSTMNFNKNCEVNNPYKERRACIRYCEGKDKNELPELIGVSAEAITIFIERCKCEFTEQQEQFVCIMRNIKKSDEEIAKLPVFKDRFTVEQIANVDCS